MKQLTIITKIQYSFCLSYRRSARTLFDVSCKYEFKGIYSDSKVSYFFLAAWDQEPNGIKTQDAFVDYLGKTVQQLNQPISVNYAD